MREEGVECSKDTVRCSCNVLGARHRYPACVTVTARYSAYRHVMPKKGSATAKANQKHWALHGRREGFNIA